MSIAYIRGTEEVLKYVPGRSWKMKMKIGVNWHGIELKSMPKVDRVEYFPGMEASIKIGKEWDPDAEEYEYEGYNDAFLRTVTALSPVPFEEFIQKGTGKLRDYTHQNFVILEGLPIEMVSCETTYPGIELDRVVLHGEAFRFLDVDPVKILTQAPDYNFRPQRIDLCFDVSADYLPYEVINDCFVFDLLTTRATYTPWTSKDGAKTWYCGTHQRDGYRFAFYEAAKIHSELPKGAWRIELQMYGSDSREFTELYLQDPTQEFLKAYVLQKLKARLKFRIKGNDTNKDRWKVPGWWTEIIKGAGNYSENKKVTKPVRAENKLAWLLQDHKKKSDSAGLDMYIKSIQDFLQMYPLSVNSENDFPII